MGRGLTEGTPGTQTDQLILCKQTGELVELWIKDQIPAKSIILRRLKVLRAGTQVAPWM